MSLETNKVKFGEFLFDAKEKVLLRQGKPVSITPKTFELLLVLVENHGHLVEKNELMKAVWADSFVEVRKSHLYDAAFTKSHGRQ